MSFYFGTQNELLYSYFGNATPLGTFTTEDNLQKTYPAVVIPGGYFANAGTRSSCIRILAQGVMGSTASPTFTFSHPPDLGHAPGVGHRRHRARHHRAR